MRVMVTGGAGFIGSHICERLVRGNHQVIAVDNLSAGKKENLPSSVALIQESITSSSTSFDELVKDIKPDVICHQAAIPSVWMSIQDPLQNLQSNFMATHKVLMSAAENKVRRVVFASSAAVYGSRESCANEEQSTEPISPYGAAKASCEMFATAASHAFKLETVCLRYFNVYGPRQSPMSEYSGVISKLLKAAYSGETFTVFGDGKQTRDFIYVDDVAVANVLAITNATPLLGVRANVATGTSTSINDLITTVQEYSGKRLTVKYVDARPGDIRHSQASTSLSKFYLGFTAFNNLKTGIARTCEWYSENHTTNV